MIPQLVLADAGATFRRKCNFEKVNWDISCWGLRPTNVVLGSCLNSRNHAVQGILHCERLDAGRATLGVRGRSAEADLASVTCFLRMRGCRNASREELLLEPGKNVDGSLYKHASEADLRLDVGVQSLQKPQGSSFFSDTKHKFSNLIIDIFILHIFSSCFNRGTQFT